MPPARKAGPVKKYSFRQRKRETLPRSEQIRVSPLEKKRQGMERLEIPSYIISLIDRFIIDVRSILDFHFTFFFSFSFFSFTLTRTAELSFYPRFYNETETMRIPLLPRSDYLSFDLSFNLANSAYASLWS